MILYFSFAIFNIWNEDESNSFEHIPSKNPTLNPILISSNGKFKWSKYILANISGLEPTLFVLTSLAGI